MNRFRISLIAVLAPFLVLASCAGNLPRDPEPKDFPVHGIDISRWQGDIDWSSARRGGVSFAFMKDVVADPQYLEWILSAWISWGLSITIILITFYTSNEAFRRAIRNLDEGKENGGVWSTATSWLNFFAGTLFVLGVLFLVLFVALNLT